MMSNPGSYLKNSDNFTFYKNNYTNRYKLRANNVSPLNNASPTPSNNVTSFGNVSPTCEKVYSNIKQIHKQIHKTNLMKKRIDSLRSKSNNTQNIGFKTTG